MVRQKRNRPNQLDVDDQNKKSWNAFAEEEGESGILLNDDINPVSVEDDLPESSTTQEDTGTVVRKGRKKKGQTNNLPIQIEKFLSGFPSNLIVHRSVNIKYVEIGSLVFDINETSPDFDAIISLLESNGHKLRLYYSTNRRWYERKNGEITGIVFYAHSECWAVLECPALTVEIIRALGRSQFVLRLRDKSWTKDKLEIEVYLTEAAFTDDPIHDAMPGGGKVAIKQLMKYVTGIEWDNAYSIKTGESKTKENLGEFYRRLKDKRDQMNTTNDSVTDNLNVQHPHLIPLLRPYQKDAVRWMLCCEKVQNSYERNRWISRFVQIGIGDHCAWYNPVHGQFIKYNPDNYPVTSYPGGILADEMGLGKTVEVLACVLLNPRVKNISSEESPESVVVEVMEPENDDVSTVLEEVISRVVGIVDCQAAYKASPKKRRSRNSLSPRKRHLVYDDVCSKRVHSNTQPLKCTCFINEYQVDSLERIQCTVCQCWQHRQCVKWTWDSTDDYMCPYCIVSKAPIAGGATLIISPDSICYQWYEEIQKHIRKYALKVYIYRGVRIDGFVQPKFLAEQDLVICTYQTLRTEINYVDLPTKKPLRQPKKYMTVPSPLTAVNWWRICLDEAQMVEGVSTKAAEMCVRLSAENRWCITGTPLQKSVSELYGLMVFLGVQPYYVKVWWDELLWHPYTMNGDWTPMLETMVRIMWRNEKVYVKNQLAIPEQVHRLYWYDFSPIEEHFYRRTQESCSQNATTILARYQNKSVKLADLDRRSVDELMRPLLSLRRACVHPQATKTGKFLPLNKKTMTMGEVLEKMIQDTKREAIEDHRALVAAFNGIAGIHWLREEWPDAADCYRKVLRSCRDHADRFEADRLQQIHTMHNLGILIDRHRNVIPPTVGDDQLLYNERALTDRFLSERNAQIVETRKELFGCLAKTKELSDQIKTEGGWFMEITQQCTTLHNDLELVQHVRDTLLNTKITNGAYLKFRDTNGLCFVLSRFLTDLQRSRGSLVNDLNKLQLDSISADFVEEVSKCHLRPIDGTMLETCPMCKLHDQFTTYENYLYNFSEESDAATSSAINDGNEDDTLLPSTSLNRTVAELHKVHLMTNLRRGTWAPSPQEQALKALYHFGKTRVPVRKEVLECGQKQLSLFGSWKKEFSALREFWSSVQDYISQRDELHMTLERFRFKSAGEVEMGSLVLTGVGQPLNAIAPHEIEHHFVRLKMDLVSARSLLERRLGHLSYLSNLNRLEMNSETGNLDDCRICLGVLGQRWALLVCGHCFCCDCIQTLLTGRFSAGNKIKCPVCRQRTHRSNVSYVMTRAAREQIDDVEVKGNHSTKVEEIVRCLLSISQKEIGAKSLVFSNWVEVLSIVSYALTENNIPHINLQSKSKHTDISNFRSQPNIKVLLLPVHSGANGLNLVEATHVLLVDPLLNPAAEQQAIGRVHRIGQTHKTTVHRFLMRATIEERIHCILGDQSINEQLSSDTESPLTLAQLAELFLPR